VAKLSVPRLVIAIALGVVVLAVAVPVSEATALPGPSPTPSLVAVGMLRKVDAVHSGVIWCGSFSVTVTYAELAQP
jgi:hypothetical protein